MGDGLRGRFGASDEEGATALADSKEQLGDGLLEGICPRGDNHVHAEKSVESGN